MILDWAAVSLTFHLALATMLILVVIGLPLSWWLVHSRARWKFLVESLVTLPLILPPTVFGFYILIAAAPTNPVGALYDRVVGRPLAFSFAGLLLASVLFNLPFATRPFIAALSGVNRRYIESSWCLGTSRTRTFFRLVIPLAWPGILGGMILAFAHTVGEFGVALMVGGNIPGVTRTLSILIYDDVQALNYHAANVTSLALVGFSFIVLCLVYLTQRRTPLA